MGTLTKLTSGGQVTLPKEIRVKTNMQPGDFVEVKLDEEGRIVLTPKKLVDASRKGSEEDILDAMRDHLRVYMASLNVGKSSDHQQAK